MLSSVLFTDEFISVLPILFTGCLFLNITSSFAAASFAS